LKSNGLLRQSLDTHKKQLRGVVPGGYVSNMVVVPSLEYNREPNVVKTWNVAAILALTGGAQGLKQLLGRHGQAVPDASAISMWKARGRLPGNWSAQVIYALGESQTPVDLKLLIIDAGADTDDDLFAA
jgi:hypothetical protein